MQQKRSLFGPLLLIAAGVIWLLIRAGTIPSSNLWALTYIWPFLLIAAGIGAAASVARLPHVREALVLRFSEELAYDEIAAVMECPLGTVKSRIFHGLAGLRRLLDEKDAGSLQPPQRQDRTG